MDFEIRELKDKWFAETLPVNSKWELRTTIGAGKNGTILIADDTATALAIEVKVAAGNSAALAAAVADGVIIVTLGTDSDGAADATKNTALLVAGAINGIVGATWEATASGTGATALTAAIAKKNLVTTKVAYGTPCPIAGTTSHDGTNACYYVSTRGDNTDENDSWKKITLANW